MGLLVTAQKEESDFTGSWLLAPLLITITTPSISLCYPIKITIIAISDTWHFCRCVGGHLQLRSARLEAGGSEDSEELEDMESYDPDELAICGPNERYAPPIVMFKDSASANSASVWVVQFPGKGLKVTVKLRVHCWYIEPRNREKSLTLIWQRFSCLRDEWIAKISKKNFFHGGFLR